MSNFNLDNVTQINILASFSLSPPPPSPGSPEVGIYGFCLNLNRSVFLGCAGSHIHVNMNMKMTGWLSDMGCVTMRGWVCVNLFNNLRVCTCAIACVFICPHGCPHGRFVTQTVCGHHYPLQRLSVSTSSYSPTHCQVPLTSSLQLSCENVGPRWEE